MVKRGVDLDALCKEANELSEFLEDYSPERRHAEKFTFKTFRFLLKKRGKNLLKSLGNLESTDLLKIRHWPTITIDYTNPLENIAMIFDRYLSSFHPFDRTKIEKLQQGEIFDDWKKRLYRTIARKYLDCFPIKRGGVVSVKPKTISFPVCVKYKEAITEFKRCNLRPATFYELLAFKASFAKARLRRSVAALDYLHPQCGFPSIIAHNCGQSDLAFVSDKRFAKGWQFLVF